MANLISLDRVPDFAKVEQLHRNIAPSQAAYELIHGHCVVVATISWQIAHHQNVLLTQLRHEMLPNELAERAQLASFGMQRMIGCEPLAVLEGGVAPDDYVDEYVACIGGLLHDIGTYRVLLADGTHADGELRFDGPRYIQHGILGYQYLLDHGIDESIAQFARNHTGVGLTREQVVAQHLPLPVDDYVPRSCEQEIVMVADKYNSKSIPPRFLTAQAYERKASRFGEGNARRWMQLVMQYGNPNITELAQRFDMSIS